MTAAALRNALRALLTRAGIENPDGDSRLILEYVTGYSGAAFLMHDRDEIAQEAEQQALTMARRRAGGEPIQYILGTWRFMGRDYAVGKGVLIPRDDTEVVVRAALELMKNAASPAVVDLCAGSGIIAVTLSKELNRPTVTAVEKSAEAYAYLEKNIAAHHAHVKSILADLRDCADDIEDGSLDLLISNPPYIPSGEINTLQSEVRYEPRLALDGGKDGCDLYREIIRLWSKKLKKSGIIALELGEDQYEPVRRMLEDHGYTAVKGYEDIQGTIRAVTAVYISNDPQKK